MADLLGKDENVAPVVDEQTLSEENLPPLSGDVIITTADAAAYKGAEIVSPVPSAAATPANKRSFVLTTKKIIAIATLVLVIIGVVVGSILYANHLHKEKELHEASVEAKNAYKEDAQEYYDLAAFYAPSFDELSDGIIKAKNGYYGYFLQSSADYLVTSSMELLADDVAQIEDLENQMNENYDNAAPEGVEEPEEFDDLVSAGEDLSEALNNTYDCLNQGSVSYSEFSSAYSNLESELEEFKSEIDDFEVE